MITAYSKNGWDPLKVVILGDFIPPDLLKQCLDYSKYDPVKPWLMKIAQETEEDLNNIQHILEQHGVKVIRPFDSEFRSQFERAMWGIQSNNLPFSTLPIPISPRNDLLVYKDIVIGDRPTFSRKWIKDNLTNEVIYLHDTPLSQVHLPCIFRLNDTLIIGDEITDSEYELLLPLFPADTKFIKTSIPGHVDARMATLKEGLVIYARKDVSIEDLEETYPGWTKVYCKTYGFNVENCERPNVPNFTNAITSLTNGRWNIEGYDGTDPAELVDMIDREFTKYTGKAYETHFDVNILTINPETSMTVGTDKDLIQRIEQNGHKMITVPFRHRWFFDQGLHCVTCDLVRNHG